ncbi:MAG: substrate-binding domain-containing protein [Betaproteobacteria bacterium]|nr:substrate-binding domain-containing protein [Betaproteobacteria bacterium]
MTVLHVLSAGAAKGLVQGMQEPFSAASGVSVEGAFGAVGAMREKLLAREPCDLIILTAAIIDALAAQGLVHADSVAALGRVHTGIAVPAGDAHPAIADADGLRRALEVARGIYLPDPERATAGIHFANVLRALGIFDRVRERLRPFPNGAAAMRAMADAGEPGLIGCTQVTEINYTVGVELVGLLPREFELATTYSLAVCAAAAEPALAREFAGLLIGPASLALRVKGGFVVD